MKLPFLALLLVGVAVPGTAQTLLVGNKAEHTVSFIDLAKGEEVARCETGRAPHEIAVSPDGKTAAVVSYREQGYEGNTLHLFDVASAKKLGEIALEGHRGLHGLKWMAGSGLVIVTSEVTKNVAIVDVGARKLVASIDTGMEGSHMVAVTPDHARAFVANIGSGNMSVIDLKGRKKIADVDVASQAEAVTVSPDGKEVWVGSNGLRKVVIFDAQSLVKRAEFPTGGVPIRVEHSPNGQWVAVSLADRDSVLVYDARDRRKFATFDLQSYGATTPVTMLWSPDGQKLWVAGTRNKTVAEIETARWQVTRTFQAGEGSDGLGYSALTALPTEQGCA